MNEQLQNALVQIIEKATTGIDASVSFLSSEMPDVIHQLIMWKTSYYSFYISLGLILVTFSILIASNIRKGSANREGSFWWGGDYEISGIGFFGCVACVIGFLLGVIILIRDLTSIMQIAIAPKIWLLEYAAELVK